jgi:hypothetical protein
MICAAHGKTALDLNIYVEYLRGDNESAPTVTKVGRHPLPVNGGLERAPHTQ